MPSYKEKVVTLPKGDLKFDEALSIENEPIVITHHVELFAVDFGTSFGVAQLYRYPKSPDMKTDVKLIERLKAHEEFQKHLRFAVTPIHHDGKDVGLLFTQQHSYPRLSLLYQRLYLPRADFDLFRAQLRRLTDDYQFDTAVLTDKSLFYNSNHEPGETGFFLGAVTAGSYKHRKAFEIDVKKRFETLPNGYCST